MKLKKYTLYYLYHGAEGLLVKIKFVVDMYSSGVDTVDGTLEKIFDLVDDYEKEVAE